MTDLVQHGNGKSDKKWIILNAFGSCLAAVWHLFGSCLGSAWQLPGCFLVAAWHLLDCCLAAADSCLAAAYQLMEISFFLMDLESNLIIFGINFWCFRRLLEAILVPLGPNGAPLGS